MWRRRNASSIPDSKIHGDNMGPTWVLSAPDGPMLAPWTLLSGITYSSTRQSTVWSNVWMQKKWKSHPTQEPLSAFVARRPEYHDDVIKWNHFPCYWFFVRGIHRLPVDSPQKAQWHGVLMLSLICLNKRLSKHSRSRWFETPLGSLWRHCNG